MHKLHSPTSLPPMSIPGCPTPGTMNHWQDTGFIPTSRQRFQLDSFYYVFFTAAIYTIILRFYISVTYQLPQTLLTFSSSALTFSSSAFYFTSLYFFSPKTLISFIAIPSPYQPKYCFYSNLLLTLAAAHAGPSRNRKVAQYQMPPFSVYRYISKKFSENTTAVVKFTF